MPPSGSWTSRLKRSSAPATASAAPSGKARRNGDRDRQWQTRFGAIDPQELNRGQGSYFPPSVLEPRPATGHAVGAKGAGVSGLCRAIDERVQPFPYRLLEAAWPFRRLDAIHAKSGAPSASRRRRCSWRWASTPTVAGDMHSLAEGPAAHPSWREGAGGVVRDADAHGAPLGIDIQQAARTADTDRPMGQHLPLKAFDAA